MHCWGSGGVGVLSCFSLSPSLWNGMGEGVWSSSPGLGVISSPPVIDCSCLDFSYGLLKLVGFSLEDGV